MDYKFILGSNYNLDLYGSCPYLIAMMKKRSIYSHNWIISLVFF